MQELTHISCRLLAQKTILDVWYHGGLGRRLNLIRLEEEEEQNQDYDADGSIDHPVFKFETGISLLLATSVLLSLRSLSLGLGSRGGVLRFLSSLSTIAESLDSLVGTITSGKSHTSTCESSASDGSFSSVRFGHLCVGVLSGGHPLILDRYRLRGYRTYDLGSK